jgi:hypothetical protein
LRSPETKDSTRAREFHAAISGEVDRHWKALGQPTQPLSHQQVVALSGLVYKMMTEGHVDDPGSSSLWQGLMLLQNNAINPDRLAQWLGPTVDAILVREGVRTDGASRSRLIEEVREGTNQAAAQLARNANGNFQPDPDAARFSEWTRPKPPEGEQTKPVNEAKGAALTGLMEGWWREAKAVGRSTRNSPVREP